MPRRSRQPPIQCDYFLWHLRQRDGVYYADGRTNRPSLGKHSLGTRDREEALRRLKQLDLKQAIDRGRAKQNSVRSSNCALTIADGWNRYLGHCGRSEVLGGVAASTLRRYELVRDRQQKHCEKHGIHTWEEFGKSEFECYGNWMHDRFAYRTIYVDLTQIKAVINWFINEGLLSADRKINYPLRKPFGSDTYCYSRSEVAAMVDYCRAISELKWMGHVIIALSHMGVRFGELAALRWNDIDFRADVVRVADERASHRKMKAGSARTTKGRRTRNIPLHRELKKDLLAIPRQTDGRVFHSARGAMLRENNALAALKKRIIRPLAEKFPTAEGEIGFEHGTFHSFRHYFTSQCFIAAC